MIRTRTYKDFGIELESMFGSGEVYTTCPKCSKERRKKHAKCLSVNLDKQVWCCHHCGWSGTIKDGERRSTVQHWQRPQWIRPEQPNHLPRDRMYEWFARRGIPAAVLDRNKVSVTSIYMPQEEGNVNVIVFPYFRAEERVNHKYRDSSKNFRMDANAERMLYGFNDIEDDLTVIVEGEIDKLSVEVCGFQACVSVPDGAPTPTAKDYSSKFEFLTADEERIGQVKRWVIAVDNDAPGQRLEDELSRRLGREKCMHVTWPEGCKDANEVLNKFGAAKVRECIAEAKPYPIAGVFEVLDLSSRVWRLYEHGWEKGMKTGWEELDKLYTVRPGEFTVITGVPNSGKSNLLDCLLVNLAELHGWGHAIFSPENQPLEDHVARTLEKFAKLPFGEGPFPRMSKADLELSIAWAQEHFNWILPDSDMEWSIDNVLDSARQLVKRKGIRTLTIDPWNELEHQRPASMSETEYISLILKRIRTFGRQNGVHVFLVAHPTKLYRDKNGQYPIPTLYDIAGSAHFRNKCDNGLCIVRDFAGNESDEVEVHVQKIRFRQIGKLGDMKLRYDKVTQTYGPYRGEHMPPSVPAFAGSGMH